jgi:poly(3-hydroxybutyrate) depolymerase
MGKTILLGALLFVIGMNLQAALPPGEHGMSIVSSTDGTTQPYRLFVPSRAVQTSAPLPLVVVLHGWGVDEYAWFKFTPVKRFADQFGFVIAAPYARGNWWYRGPAEQDVLDVIENVKKALPIDERRVYLAGHSMGGWGTWWIGLRHPDLFAAIAPMAGFDPREFAAGAVNLDPSVIHDIPDPIVPVEQSRAPVAVMAARGISHVYREEVGYGHASRMIGDNLPRVFEWFTHHSREDKPRRVSLASRLPGASVRWLLLVETERWPRPALIDAWVDADGVLVVRQENVRAFALHVGDLPASASLPLKVRIDKQELAAERSTAWLQICRERKNGNWALSESTDKPAIAPLPSLKGAVAQELAAAQAEDRLATACAEILRKHFAADACVVDADKIRVARGTLTVEKLLDAWVYPEDRLVAAKINPQTLQGISEVISKGKALVIPAEVTNSKRKLVNVILPQAVANQLHLSSDKVKPAGDLTIGELLAKLATDPANFRQQ